MKRSTIGLKPIFTSLLIGMFVFGCAHSSYNGERRHWTKNDRLFNGKQLEAQLIWRGTYFSDHFRRAYEKRHIELNHLNASEAAAWRADQKKTSDKYHEFFINFYTQREYHEFSLNPDTFWKLVLIAGDGKEIFPVAIDEMDVNPYYRKMFPELNHWSHGYRVLFPKKEIGSNFSLALRSVLGESVLHW